MIWRGQVQTLGGREAAGETKLVEALFGLPPDGNYRRVSYRLTPVFAALPSTFTSTIVSGNVAPLSVSGDTSWNRIGIA